MYKTITNKIIKNVPLSRYTTFKVGGPADYFIEIEDEKEFENAIVWAMRNGIEYFVLGRGANVLVNDSGYRGLIIYTGKYNKIYRIGDDIIAQCGALIDDLINYTLDNAVSGLEFFAGMPGTVGGAVYMNARAYGGEISNVIKEATVLVVNRQNKSIERVLMSKKDLGFSYKKSILQKRDLFLLNARFSLKKGDPDRIAIQILEIRRLRKEKGEYLFPSAGCIFKNNYSLGKSSGKIIDECGLKGLKVGDAEVYERHANFIVNKGNATAKDIYQLIRLIENEVKERTGIELEREIILLGFGN